MTLTSYGVKWIREQDSTDHMTRTRRLKNTQSDPTRYGHERDVRKRQNGGCLKGITENGILCDIRLFHSFLLKVGVGFMSLLMEEWVEVEVGLRSLP